MKKPSAPPAHLHVLSLGRAGRATLETAAADVSRWIDGLGAQEPRLLRLFVIEEGGGEPPLDGHAGLLRALTASRIDWGGDPPEGAPTHRVRLVNGLPDESFADIRVHFHQGGKPSSLWLDLRLAAGGEADLASRLDRLVKWSIETLVPDSALLRSPDTTSPGAFIERRILPAPPEPAGELAPSLPETPPQPSSPAPPFIPSFMRPELAGTPPGPLELRAVAVPDLRPAAPGEATLAAPPAPASGPRPHPAFRADALREPAGTGPILAGARLAITVALGGADGSAALAEAGLDPTEWTSHLRAFRDWLAAPAEAGRTRIDVFRYLAHGAPAPELLPLGVLRSHRSGLLFERLVALAADIAAADSTAATLASYGLPPAPWTGAAERARAALSADPALASRLRRVAPLVARG